MRRAWPWIVALLVTLASAVYQRVTGPTYPVRIHRQTAGVTVTGKLPRSHPVTGDLPIRLSVTGDGAEAVTGAVVWRRLGTGEPWRRVPLAREGDGSLAAALPRQPAAGKLEYWVELHAGDRTVRLDRRGEAIVARFKGPVPAWLLAPHILLMFLGMLWSTRAGLAGLTGDRNLPRLAWTAFALLLVGGMVLGPLVQKHAFGAYWTGWPLGEDLTDNKLAAAVLAWLWAAARSRRPGGRPIAVVAAVVVLGVFLIPHSMHGSTLDYGSGKMISG